MTDTKRKQRERKVKIRELARFANIGIGVRDDCNFYIQEYYTITDKKSPNYGTERECPMMYFATLSMALKSAADLLTRQSDVETLREFILEYKRISEKLAAVCEGV